MSDQNWEKAEDLLRAWMQRARKGQHSHHEAGKHFRRLNYWLALPVITITTSLGTAAFATTTAEIEGAGNIIFGGLSMLAAILAAVQTHFRYAEKSEKHKSIGAEYGNIRREIEATLSLSRNERPQPKNVLDGIRSRLDTISNEGDVVSRRVFEKTQRRLAAKDALARQRPPQKLSSHE